MTIKYKCEHCPWSFRESFMHHLGMTEAECEMWWSESVMLPDREPCFGDPPR